MSPSIVAAFLLGHVLTPPGFVARIGQPASDRLFAGDLIGVSADGKRLYTIVPTRGTEIVSVSGWDANTGRLLTRHPLHTSGEEIVWHGGGGWHLGLGPEGLRVAVRAGKDFTHFLRVIDPDTGRTLQMGGVWPYPQVPDDFKQLHRPRISSSPDGKWVLRREPAACKVYATATGEAVKIDLADTLRLHGTQFSCDGGLFVISATNGTVRVYDLPGGKLRREIRNPAADQFAAVCTPDGKGLVVWVLRKDAWSLEFVNFATGDRRTVLDRQPATGLIVFSPDGKSFARLAQVSEWPDDTPAGDWEVRDWGTGHLLARAPAVRDAAKAVFSPDGKTLHVQVGQWGSEFLCVLPWDVATDKPRLGTAHPFGTIERFRFTADGQLVGLAGGFVHVRDPPTGKSRLPVRVPSGIDWHRGAVFGPTGHQLEYGLPQKFCHTASEI